MASVTMLLAFLTAMCLISEAQSQLNPNICIPPGPGGGGLPLPVLPEQFMLRVEVNILGRNQTIEVVEYYDDVENRGAVHTISGGDTFQTVMNYGTQEIITVQSDGVCTVHNLTAGGFNVFGFQLRNGMAHVSSVNDIFRFGAAYNETYVGPTYVRGIPANHWRSCLYEEAGNRTSSLNYYFTRPGYNSSYGDAQIPLRLALNGTGSNFQFVDGHIVLLPGYHSYSHVYEFFDVQFHPEFADRTFEPQLGVVCPGRKSLKPLPNIPDRFYLMFEVVMPDWKRVFYASVAYNYKAKIVSYYYSLAKNGSHVPTHYRALDDFNTGLTYKINMSSGFCNITPIALSSPNAISPDNAHVQIKHVASFFDFGDQDWQYQGVTQLRGMETESWIVEKINWRPTGMPKSTQINSTWEYFFTTAAWKAQSGLNGTSSIPVAAKIRWNQKTDTGQLKSSSLVLNYFDFDTYVDMSHFDLSPCFNSVDSEEMGFDILEMGIFDRYIANNTVAFYHGASYSIAMAAGVTPTRIANILAWEDNDGVTTVFFTILGVPEVEGDAVNMTKQLPLGDAITHLDLKINSVEGLFLLEFDHNGMETFLTPQPDSLRTTFKPSVPNTDDSQQYSVGAFVGFGVAMLILGVALGVGILIFIHKKTNLNVPYNVQS